MQVIEQATKSTKRRRKRTTRSSVRVADKIARWIITLGGIATIGAVTLVGVFLVWVAVPLFVPESSDLQGTIAVRNLAPETQLAGLMSVDQSCKTGGIVTPEGIAYALNLMSGEVISTDRWFSGDKPVTSSPDLRTGDIAFAFPEGVIRQCHISFADDKMVARIGDPISVESKARIVLIDQVTSERGDTLAMLLDDSTLRVTKVTKTKNLLSGKTTNKLVEGAVALELGHFEQLPSRLLLTGLGENVFLTWDNGRLLRFDTRDVSSPQQAEELDLVEDPQAKLTALTFLTGRSGLASGDSQGNVGIWYRVKPKDAKTVDGAYLRRAHQFSGASSVTHLVSSSRSRSIAVGYENGEATLFHVTSSQQLGRVSVDGGPFTALALAPKDDGLVGIANNKAWHWNIHAEHPEVTWKSIFLPVWYEGYESPETVWQSSSGTDDFEPKYGLFPLIFGTLKATFYTMLFGTPIALLAAIYSSEFLHRRVRARIKPIIEMMASLPSVVLGFIAGGILAPAVEDYVPHILTALATIPFAFLCGAQFWQLLPGGTWLNFSRKYRLWVGILALPAGIYLAFQLGPAVERWLFAGDIKGWLAQQGGDGTGAWMLCLLPLSALFVVWICTSVVNPGMRRHAGHWGRGRFALLDLTKFLVACVATVLIAYAVARIAGLVGWDPRGTLVSTYSQRNALIVGFVMGFAVIPIIYTISDDALAAVPDSLRAGSLGVGATPWQTAVRVVIPTAMSGLFSAIMVGLGRAVGETMIVVMATGNTPTKSLNIFDGFRTLSANIATELPEAVENSTHYRMLFLAGLCLFVMTFTINTAAEVVRQRYRKRNYRL